MFSFSTKFFACLLLHSDSDLVSPLLSYGGDNFANETNLRVVFPILPAVLFGKKNNFLVFFSKPGNFI